jgi:hypothetical protein
LVSSNVRYSVAKYWSGELGDSRNVESLYKLQVTAIRWRNGIINSQVETLNISGPKKTSAFLTIERRGSTMTDTENVSIFLRGVGDKRELRIAASRATELEDMSLVLDNIDVDVSACTGVYRVLVLSDLDCSI